jgi:glycosyltransferase involved in cell wall biosynthesis
MSPLTLQEAQLMQKPVLATNVGGIPELIKNNETGFLVKKEDHEDLFEKLEILLNDKTMSKKMGTAGRDFISNNFSWEIISQNFKEKVENHLDLS